jgi:hypothetical protein
MPHARGALLRSYPKRLAKIAWRIGLTARFHATETRIKTAPYPG